MHWTLFDLWSIPTSYYTALIELVEEEARDRARH